MCHVLLMKCEDARLPKKVRFAPSSSLTDASHSLLIFSGVRIWVKSGAPTVPDAASSDATASDADAPAGTPEDFITPKLERTGEKKTPCLISD